MLTVAAAAVCAKARLAMRAKARWRMPP
jgi:hypothetical protein